MRMADRSVQRSIQPPAKPTGGKSGKAAKTTARAGSVPAVVRRGHLTPQQVRHAVDSALRGQTFEADA